MKYSEMNPGMYVVRTKELSWARVLSGNICYITDVLNSTGELVMQLTKDCVPCGKKFKVPKEGDDGFWHDATALVFEANCAIQPPQTTCMYCSPVASNYRNYLGIQDITPTDGEDAQDRLCLLGEQTPTGILFAKTGYWVVAHVDGYYIAYQGYCDYLEEGVKRETTLRVLRLSGDRHFYPADEIVNRCSQAFQEDLERNNQYTRQIFERALGNQEFAEDAFKTPGKGVQFLELESAF